MGSRSRKRRADAPPAAPRHRAPRYGEAAPGEQQPPPRADAMGRGYARAEARNEQVRQDLEPLAPGERPGAVTVAAIVAFVLGVANTVAIVLGETIGGDEVTIAGVGLSAVLFVCAIFMWQARYWAVLGFQALLALTVMIAGLSLTVASNAIAVLGSLAIVLLGGWLFWKLVRALARLQMPAR